MRWTTAPPCTWSRPEWARGPNTANVLVDGRYSKRQPNGCMCFKYGGECPNADWYGTFWVRTWLTAFRASDTCVMARCQRPCDSSDSWRHVFAWRLVTACARSASSFDAGVGSHDSDIKSFIVYLIGTGLRSVPSTVWTEVTAWPVHFSKRRKKCNSLSKDLLLGHGRHPWTYLLYLSTQ